MGRENHPAGCLTQLLFGGGGGGGGGGVGGGDLNLREDIFPYKGPEKITVEGMYLLYVSSHNSEFVHVTQLSFQ